MNRTEVYNECIEKLSTWHTLLLELPTGYGKSKLSLDLVNHIVDTKYNGMKTSMLLLVAKTVHKQTWRDEIKKWGGLKVGGITIECYESLKKHENEHFDIIVMDEFHHIGSDLRLEYLDSISFDYALGLSATIPRKLKSYFIFNYHAQTVSCDLADAIENEVLPEPKIVLLPLQLDNTRDTETIELNPKAKGKTYYGAYKDIWKYRKQRVHAFISCTQRQKVNEYNAQILREKNLYMRNRQAYMKNIWLFDCGERLKYLANLKNNTVLSILYGLVKERTITFCKTIEQAEYLGKYCIHSKNKHSDELYKKFNEKKINHITSVNILNENANLVDCKYAVFANYASSETVAVQRIGRSLRHKSPVIIMPYYEHTREQEIVEDMLKDFNKDCIITVHSKAELTKAIK